MKKRMHEIRDPIHTFIRLDGDERIVVDSLPMQRLRHIHQLAMSFLLYPAATHKRFEHSLGVMELATRAFDGITRKAEDGDESSVRELVRDAGDLQYWRRTLRMAALCHDVGHLPFSHAAEKKLLPSGWNHERLSVELIRSPLMCDLWDGMAPPKPHPLDITKLAVGQKTCADCVRSGDLPREAEVFSDWETILSEVITGDAFGVDRMDYLLRDAYHAGVAYGRFDHFRLIDTLRILPTTYEESKELSLGVEEGGLHSAESLLLARYFMYTQVYFHPIRKVYDAHLQDFLTAWLSEHGIDGRFPTSIDGHLATTDNEVTAAIYGSARDEKAIGHDAARRIMEHDHYQMVYRPTPEYLRADRDISTKVFDSLCKQFGIERFRHMAVKPKASGTNFPVLRKEHDIVSSLRISEVLGDIPGVGFDFVFAEPGVYQAAKNWITENIGVIIEPRDMEVEDESTKA